MHFLIKFHDFVTVFFSALPDSFRCHRNSVFYFKKLPFFRIKFFEFAALFFGKTLSGESVSFHNERIFYDRDFVSERHDAPRCLFERRKNSCGVFVAGHRHDLLFEIFDTLQLFFQPDDRVVQSNRFRKFFAVFKYGTDCRRIRQKEIGDLPCPSACKECFSVDREKLVLILGVL